MKKFLLLSVTALIGLTGCKKDDDSNPGPTTPDTLENRLVSGTWVLTEVAYSGEVPNPLDPINPIPFSGNGTNVSGDFNFSKNPYEMDFNFAFTASVAGAGSFPVSRSGSGTWTSTSDESRVVLTPDGQDDMLFDVEVNEKNKQVWTGVVPYTLPPPFSVTIMVNVDFTLEK